MSTTELPTTEGRPPAAPRQASRPAATKDQRRKTMVLLIVLAAVGFSGGVGVGAGLMARATASTAARSDSADAAAAEPEPGTDPVKEPVKDPAAHGAGATPATDAPSAVTPPPQADPSASTAPVADAPVDACSEPLDASSDLPPAGAFYARTRTGDKMDAKDLGWFAGCPVPPSDLVLLEIPYWSVPAYGTGPAPTPEEKRDGKIVIHKSAAPTVCAAFRAMYEKKFPLTSVKLVTEFPPRPGKTESGSDDASMKANNTSSFNCRPPAGGSGGFSEHAYGRALDINPLWNPFYVNGRVMPAEGQAYVSTGTSDRTSVLSKVWAPDGVFHKSDHPIVQLFKGAGWGWGGEWSSKKDYQHFSSSGK